MLLREKCSMTKKHGQDFLFECLACGQLGWPDERMGTLTKLNNNLRRVCVVGFKTVKMASVIGVKSSMCMNLEAGWGCKALTQQWNQWGGRGVHSLYTREWHILSRTTAKLDEIHVCIWGTCQHSEQFVLSLFLFPFLFQVVGHVIIIFLV